MYSVSDLLAIDLNYLLEFDLVKQEVSVVKFIVRYPLILFRLLKAPVMLRWLWARGSMIGIA